MGGTPGYVRVEVTAMIAVPGVKVTAEYRRPHCGGPNHVGEVLSVDDPRAWTGSIAFPESPEPAKVRAHVEWCVSKVPGFLDKVPVRWSFGKTYWESVSDLQPLPETEVPC